MPFELPEYEKPYSRFVREATDAVLSHHPVLGGIQRSETTGPVDSAIVSDDGEEMALPGAQVGMTHSIDVPSLIKGDFEPLHQALLDGAKELAEGMMKLLYSTLTTVTRSTGNVVKTEGDLTWADVFAGFEKCEWSVDDEGKVRPPDTLLVNPKTLEQLGEPSPEDLQTFAELVARKQEEHDARKSTRRLP